MLDLLEALEAVHETGTVTEAAARLRLTQSAISKRIKALETQTKLTLIEPQGRRVRLTPAGLRLVEKGRPLLAEFRLLLSADNSPSETRLTLAVSESIMTSWGASALQKVVKQMNHLKLEVHVHRSLLATEFVRSGKYMMALCSEPASGRDLQFLPLLEEPLVIVNSEFAPVAKKNRPKVWNVISIEEASSTWKLIEQKLKRAEPHVTIENRVESFAAIVQMVKAGFGHGLIPLAVARGHHVPEAAITRLDPAPLRRIGLVARESLLAQTWAQSFSEKLRKIVDPLDRT